MPPDPILDVRHVSKSYGEVRALRDVDLQVAPGAITALLGPSGCGKSTLLRIVAGLERADQGAVWFDRQRIDDVPTHRRGFGLMFQDYALFPHRNVAENVAFGLRMQHATREAIRRRVEELLDLVGLAGYGRRTVDALSGGERQRVALARSLAPNPRLLMLDEPLGALDRTLRERLLDELREILTRVGVTSLYVTHDQAEAFAIADQVVLMNAGRIEQDGPPQQVYRHPISVFAARFLGLSNLLAGTVHASGSDGTQVDTSLGRLRIAEGGLAAGAQVTLVVRPEAARLLAPTDTAATNIVRGVLAEQSFRGGHTRVLIKAADQRLEFELDATALPTPGSAVVLALRPEAMSVIVG